MQSLNCRGYVPFEYAIEKKEKREVEKDGTLHGMEWNEKKNFCERFELRMSLSMLQECKDHLSPFTAIICIERVFMNQNLFRLSS